MLLKLDVRLTSLEFVNGLQVDFPENGILAVIGPNNSGKSTALTEIKGQASTPFEASTIIRSVNFRRVTGLEDVEKQLRPLADRTGHLQIGGHGFNLSLIEHWWNASSLGSFFVQGVFSELTTRARLGDCDPPASMDMRVSPYADHPFQRMYADDKLELAVSAAFRRAFRKDLVVHRLAGSVIPVYVGDRPKTGEGEDRMSRSYIDRIERLDQLERQGDGMRSFASVVGRVMTESRPIRLIDEPEAFLHPPQAKIVADVIASEGRGSQTIIATHSSDVIQGLLGENKGRVIVVRLMRTAHNTQATMLATEAISQLWSDPILRFSNILDGLFHDGVIITEAEADCRFYEGISEKVLTNDDKIDVHYAYAGGKDRVAKLVSALTSVNVPVASVLDFDVLNNEQPLRRIVEAHRGNWIDVEGDWRSVKTAIEAKDVFLSGDKYREEVQNALCSYSKGSVVPKEVLSKIKKLSREASPWDNVKNAGLNIVPPGHATQAAQRLLTKLSDIGVFVVPSGEMEGFCRSIGTHGIRWVEKVMEKDLRQDTELEGARRFVGDIFDFLRKRGSISVDLNVR